MTVATPAFMTDLKAKITALLPTDFPADRVFVGKERPVGGEVLEEATWLRFVDEVPEHYDATGSIRAFTVQVKHRFNKQADREGAAAHARMWLLFDAANKLGQWTGASAAVYLDLVARSSPAMVEDQYVVMDLTVWHDTVST